jgi:hypothetical protein
VDTDFSLLLNKHLAMAAMTHGMSSYLPSQKKKFKGQVVFQSDYYHFAFPPVFSIEFFDFSNY